MKHTLSILALTLSVPLAVFASDNFATAKDAEAMVGKVVKSIAADRAGTYTQIIAKDKKWVQGDLYPVVYDMNASPTGRTPSRLARICMAWLMPTARSSSRNGLPWPRARVSSGRTTSSPTR